MNDQKIYKRYKSLGLQDTLIFTIIIYGFLKKIYGDH